MSNGEPGPIRPSEPTPDRNAVALYVEMIAGRRHDFGQDYLAPWEDLRETRGRPFSLREWVEEKEGDPQTHLSPEELTERARRLKIKTETQKGEVAQRLFEARVTPSDEVLATIRRCLVPEDCSEVMDLFAGGVRGQDRPLREFVGGEWRTFNKDQAWLGDWKEYLKAHPEWGEEPAVPGLKNIPPERRALAEKIWRGMKVGAKNWVKNMDPRGKDKEWIIGAAVGGLESAAFMTLPVGPAKGYIKAGLNLVAAQGVYAATKGVYSLKEKQVKTKYTGDELVSKLTDLEKGHTLAAGRVRNFFLGVSAGATYTSATGLVGHLAVDAAREVGLGIQIPEISVTGLVEQAKEKIGEIKAPDLSKIVSRPEASKTPRIPQAATMPEIKVTPTASAEPVHVVPGPAATATPTPEPALGGEGAVAPAEAPHATPAPSATPAAAPESPAGAPSGPEPKTLGEAPGSEAVPPKAPAPLGPSPESPTKAVPSVGSSVGPLPGITGESGDEMQKTISGKITAVLNAEPGLFTEQTISQGETVGQMLVDAGYDITWTGKDAQLLGAHIAANWDMFNDMWQKIAENNPDLVPKDSHYPIPTITEIPDLVAKAQSGDAEALKKLTEASHWIPEGGKFKVLTKTAMGKALDLLEGKTPEAASVGQPSPAAVTSYPTGASAMAEREAYEAAAEAQKAVDEAAKKLSELQQYSSTDSPSVPQGAGTIPEIHADAGGTASVQAEAPQHITAETAHATQADLKAAEAVAKRAAELKQGSLSSALHGAGIVSEVVPVAESDLEKELANKVTETLNADPSLFTEHTVGKGTTVGEILENAGHRVTWTGQDAQVLGAHLAANYDTFVPQAAAEKMAESRLQVPYFEIHDLIAKAQAGDKEALQKLTEALRNLPTGVKFKILTKAGMDKILALIEGKA